ncbi:MAG: hypothetical protein JRI61_00130, partial [Deltaproteobacteria bacterium]|nr:hypothetical protein [Deltaproteobacteria bacterium]
MIREAINCGNAPKAHFEGLEIGAVSMKWVRRSENGETVTRIEQHGGNPGKSVQKIIEAYSKDNSPIVVTGQSARVLLDLPYRSETECLEKALKFHDLKPDLLLSLGGENFCVYPMKDGLVKNIITTSKCAAGTGEFIVQQFQRMGMKLEEGLGAGLNGKIVQLATRCSVHCKSDATHKLNKGECTPGDIATSLIHDLVKKVKKMIEGAQWPTSRIVISGGVTLNKIFVEEFQKVFRRSEVKILPESPFFEAFGASLYAAELDLNLFVSPRNKWLRNKKFELETLKPLKEAEKLLDYRVQAGTGSNIREAGCYILGVDAGSTTTKAVLLNVESKTVDAHIYLKTLGNPISATKKCLKELLYRVGNKTINIMQTGVTGSGREIVSVYLDNCQSFNEILAHARAAAEELPEVDTVFEIGGQDSKFISFLKGIPVDYAMNEGCSAGTGSFIEESSSVDMGVKMEDISGIAEAGLNPIAFGERCAAFINTDLRNALQQGAGREDVIAGLAYSIADNYISRVVGTRHIGENLLFLGGVALNRAVAMAIAARIGRKIVVPPHPELMGSVGAALMVNSLLRIGDIEEKRYNLENLVEGKMEAKGAFRCKSCENRCEIRRIGIRGKIYPFGGLCSRHEIFRHKGDETKDGRDLVAVRNKMMLQEFGPEKLTNPRGTIGLPMALTAFELFPFFAKFINELGYNMVLSEPSKEGNGKAGAAMCYPCEIAHGAVFDLLNRDVDFILLPRVIEIRTRDEDLHSYTCPSTSVIPDIMLATFENLNKKILCPHIGLSKDFMKANLKEIGKVASKLNVSRASAREAFEKAIEHYKAFRKRYHDLGEKKLKELGNEPAIIIAGRPYITFSP